MPRPPRPRSVSSLLGEPGSALSALAAGARAHADLTAAVAAALPPELLPHLRAASLDGDVLVLSADAPEWAARIRFHPDPLLEAARRHSGERVRSLRVRVR